MHTHTRTHTVCPPILHSHAHTQSAHLSSILTLEKILTTLKFQDTTKKVPFHLWYTPPPPPPKQQQQIFLPQRKTTRTTEEVNCHWPGTGGKCGWCRWPVPWRPSAARASGHKSRLLLMASTGHTWSVHTNEPSHHHQVTTRRGMKQQHAQRWLKDVV